MSKLKKASKRKTLDAISDDKAEHDVKLKIRPVTSSNWKDLEKLFEGRGGPKYCWCMVWRNMLEGRSRSSSKDKKDSLHQYVKERTPIGLLAYDGKETVAWCSVAPRESYRDMGGIKTDEQIWSLVCFYIKPDYRKSGMSTRFIEEAAKYAKKRKAKILEAYPVSRSSPSYRFGGFTETFKKAGFTKRKKAGSRRQVMTVEL